MNTATKELTVITKQYGDKPVRLTQDDAGEIWFVAKDVCEVLGIRHMASSLRAIPADEKGVQRMHTPGGEQSLSVISETGRYRLTMRCDKPEAKPFQDWVVKIVLPSIRQTGGYSINPQSETAQLIGAVKDLVVLVKDLLAEKIKPALPPIPEVSIRLKISQVIRNFVARQTSGYSHQDAFDQLYYQFKYRFHIDLKERAKHAGALSVMDYAEANGFINELLALALNIFPENY